MQVVGSHYIFYYPFSYRQFHFDQLVEALNKHHFYHFQVQQQNLHDALLRSLLRVIIFQKYRYVPKEKKLRNILEKYFALMSNTEKLRKPLMSSTAFKKTAQRIA